MKLPDPSKKLLKSPNIGMKATKARSLESVYFIASRILEEDYLLEIFFSKFS